GPAYTERINASAGQRITVMARLIRGPSTEPPRADPTPREPIPREPVHPIDQPHGDPGPTTSEAGPRWQPVVAWTAAGGAAVALGFGVGELLSANSKFHTFNVRKDCGSQLDNRGGTGCSA